MQDLDKVLPCERPRMGRFEAFQVSHGGLILAIERSRANVRLHFRLLSPRTLEL